MLIPEYTPCFIKDTKKIKKKHWDTAPLHEVIQLILDDTDETKAILKQRHNMHDLKGSWAGSNECHVANAGDWLLIWKTGNGLAVFQRTGSHDDLFR